MVKRIKTQSRSKVGTNPKKKLKWEPMKITRIKLNPEQAVLSCCFQPVRQALTGSGSVQCQGPAGSVPCPYGGGGWLSAS